jgi:hypothetical protein
MKLPGILFIALLSAAVPAIAQQDPGGPPPNAKPFLTLTGVGTQNYACTQQLGGPTWTFTGPEAELRDASDAPVGTHGAGPIWKYKDGSSAKGKLLATIPSTDPNAIPWLLLKAGESKGPGVLAGVTFIRRIDTSGGKAPETPCALSATEKVPYKATYAFYAAQ